MTPSADQVAASLPEAVRALFSGPAVERLLALRRHLHRFPELSRQETATAARLSEELAALRPASLEQIAGTGLVARIAGEDPSRPAVALRGDIDALPIHEATGLDYSSENPGVMHACGHDVHASWAVGAATLLAARPAPGDVLVVLQPAEEIAWGAEQVLASGALDGVAAIFGAHVDRRFAVGEAVVEEGPMNAASDGFRVVIRGRGAHGARPHEGADPIVGAAALITALQTLVARRLDPGSPGVVTIGMVRAGAAGNAIPETAELAGTLRATTSAVHQLLRAGLAEMVRAIPAAHGLEGELIFEESTPVVVNPARETAWARQAAVALLGEGALRTLPEVNMGGEDFGYFVQKIPGCFFRVGAREAGGQVISAHSPRFHAADGALFVGAALLAESARTASAALA